MGGTYWYYYKVDEDEECHNPAEASTTICPLLPGQRLNVLEIPSEMPGRSSESSDVFTRNPSDRYLNPVPPAPLRPLPSPSHDAPFSTSAMSLPSPWAPRSAVYPPSAAFLSPNVVRHARSASASPRMPSPSAPSAPLFADFKVLKEKLASKRSARCCGSSKSQEMEIGAPVLISTTADDMDLIPLPSYRSPHPNAGPPTLASVIRPAPISRKGFSPLGSHPVDPIRDPIFACVEAPTKQSPSLQRRRSHVVPTIVTEEFVPGHSRTRANSADTRRTKHYVFSNDPWLSSPKVQQFFELDAQESQCPPAPLPTLQRPAALAPPQESVRPSSSHGSARGLGLDFGLRLTPADKDLPELPRYLMPAPLFACNSPSSEETVEHAVEDVILEEGDESVLGDLIDDYQEKAQSHFSLWSNESIGYNSPTSDNDTVVSPTFSSLTSDGSDVESPERTTRYSFATVKDGDKRTTAIFEDKDVLEEEEEEELTGKYHLSATPPKLDLRISTFGTDLFNLDIQHTTAAPRRQAACFGLGFQYSLPDDETSSKVTVTEAALGPEPSVQRDSSVSQLTRLMDDFGYLGEAVL